MSQESLSNNGVIINPAFVATNMGGGVYGTVPLTTVVADIPGLSTTQDQSNQPPVRMVARTAAGFIVSDVVEAANYPLQIGLRNYRFNVESFDRNVDVIKRELVSPDIYRLSDRVITNLLTLEEQIAALQGQLEDSGDENARLQALLDRLTVDGQIYPEGTMLTTPRTTNTYIVYKGKRRFIPDIYVQDPVYTAAQAGYRIVVTDPVTGKSLLDTIAAAFQTGVRVVTQDEMELMPEGWVDNYTVNPTRDTVVINIPIQPQLQTVSLGLSYDEDGNVEVDDDGYPIELTKVITVTDPAKVPAYGNPPVQTISIATQSGIASITQNQAAADAQELMDLQVKLGQAKADKDTISAWIIVAIDSVGALTLSANNKGKWKGWINNEQYASAQNEAGTNKFNKINNKYVQAGNGVNYYPQYGDTGNASNPTGIKQNILTPAVDAAGNSLNDALYALQRLNGDWGIQWFNYRIQQLSQ